MIDIIRYDGEDFSAVLSSDGWRIGILRHSKRFSHLCVLERHTLTDEVFVLLGGAAVIYVSDGEKITEYEMQSGAVYNIHRGVWHHITVSEDATVLVVENSNTSAENTEKRYLD